MGYWYSPYILSVFSNNISSFLGYKTWCFLNSVRVKFVHCHTIACSDIPIDSVSWTKVVITWSLVISLLTRIPILYGMFHRRRSLLLSEYHTQEVLVWWGQSYCLLSDLTKIYIKVGLYICHFWIGNKIFYTKPKDEHQWEGEAKIILSKNYNKAKKRLLFGIASILIEITPPQLKFDLPKIKNFFIFFHGTIFTC